MVAQQEFTYKYIFIFPSVKLLQAGMYHILLLLSVDFSQTYSKNNKLCGERWKCGSARGKCGRPHRMESHEV